MGRPAKHDPCPAVERAEKKIRAALRNRWRLDGELKTAEAERRALDPSVQTIYVRKGEPGRWIAIGRMCLACRELQ